MSAAGYPYDNAISESFMSTLKREEINGTQYRDLEHLRCSLAKFIDWYYNRVRLHSALGYQSPADYEDSIDRTAA